jgi:hypothetical protein
MNRTSLFGTIAFIIWLSSAILAFDFIVEIMALLIFNLTGLLNSIFMLNLQDTFLYGIGSFVLMVLWFPYYLLGLSLLLLMVTGEE